jgi:hypothetical protein
MRSADRPARSQSLYRQHYPGPRWGTVLNRKKRRSAQSLASPVCSNHAYLATCVLQNMSTAARGRVNIRGQTKSRVWFPAIAWYELRSWWYCLPYASVSQPEFHRHRQGFLRKLVEQVNRAKNSKYRKNFLFRQLKVLEESSFLTKFLFCFVIVFTGNSSSGYKKYFRDTFIKKGGKHSSKTTLRQYPKTRVRPPPCATQFTITFSCYMLA